MITFKEALECMDYKITDGFQYQWNSYGPNAFCVEFWNGQHDSGRSVSAVYDTKTQQVYEIQAWDNVSGNEYRWIHPGYIEGHVKEANERGVNWRQSYDDNNFIDLDVVEDILEKASAIARGEEYDERVIMQMEFTEDEKHMLMEMAHEKDMSLNKYIEFILQQEIDRLTA